MTTVAVYRAGEETWIGADSMTNNGGTKHYGAAKWVFAHGWAFASASSRRTYNIIEQNKGRLFKNLASPEVFAKRLAKLLRENHYDVSPHAAESAPNFDLNAILASKTTAYVFGSSLCHIPVDFWVDGSGRAYGLGAGFSALRRRSPPQNVIAMAIGAAIEYDINSGGGIWIGTVERSRIRWRERPV